MATFNLTSASGVPRWNKKVFIIEDEITLTAAHVSGSVIECLNIPAGTVVQQVWVTTVTAAAGNTATATVGDGDAANGWDASTNLAAAAGTMTGGTPGTDATAAFGKHYATADTIDLTITLGGALTTYPKFKVTALCHKMD